MATPTPLAFLGGSGLYSLEGLSERQELHIDTPFGPPSGPLVTGRLDGAPVVFLARHGPGHACLPHEVPYRANVWALKSLGVRYLVSVSAVGSLQEALAPGDLVLPDQYIDRTTQRANTFFGAGAIAHVSLAHPVSSVLADLVVRAHQAAGVNARLHRGGTYVAIEGPQFSTQAESRLYRHWGASVIGMTNLPEARLAREAEIAYASLCVVTDYDAWREHESPVTASDVIRRLSGGVAQAVQVIHALVPRLDAERPPCHSHQALQMGLLTPLDAIPPQTRARLQPLLARFDLAALNPNAP